MKTAIKVILILTLVYLPFMLLGGIVAMATDGSKVGLVQGISSIVSFAIATPVCIVALVKLSKAKCRKDLQVIGIITLLFGQLWAGILMLTISDAALDPAPYKSPYGQPPYGAQGPYGTPYGTPYGQGNMPPYGTPYGQGNMPPYGTPYGQGNTPPYGAPYGQGNMPPYGNPYGQGNVPPYGNPYGQGNMPPNGNPYGSPYGNPTGSPQAGVPTGATPPTAEAPAAETPVTETPVTETPVTETPVTEAPAEADLPEVTVDTVVEVKETVTVDDLPTGEVKESDAAVVDESGEIPH